MRAVRGLLITLVILALAVAVGAGALLSPPGQDYLRNRFVTWASRELGRELAVGQLRIEPGLHHLRVSATGLSLANAPWGSEPRMLSAAKLAIDVDAWSFLADTVIVHSIAVEGLSLLLERTAEGEQNWDFDLPPRESAESKFPAVIDHIAMPGARLRFIGPRLERPLEIELATLEQSRSADDMLHLSVHGTANGTELALAGDLGPFAGLIEAKHFAIDLSGSLGEIGLSANFRVDDLARPVDTSATLRLQGPDAAYLASKLGVRNLGDGPLDLTATLAPAADHKGISGSVAGKIGAFTIDASGEIDEPGRMAKLSLDVRIAGPDLSLLGGIAGINALPPEAFTLAAKILREGQTLQIDDAALELADTALRVQGTVGRLDRFSGTTLHLQVHGEDIARVRKLLRIPGVATGAFDVAGTVKPGEAGVELVDVQATTSAGRATVNGNLGAYPDFFGTRLKFSVSGPDFAVIGRAAGLPDPPRGPFEAAGDAQWTPAGAVLRGTSLRIGNDRLTLDGSIGRRLRVDASDVRFALAGKNLAAVAARFSVTGLPARPYEARGEWRRLKGRDRIDNVVVSAAGARAELGGELGLAPRKIDLTVQLEGSDLAAFAGLVKGYALPPGPFSAAGGVVLSKDLLELSGVRFSVARATGTVSAQIGLPAGSAPVRIGIQARGQDLGALIPAAKRAPAESFDLGGNVAWRPGRWSFDHVRLGIGPGYVTFDGDLDQAPDFSATSLRADVHLANVARLGLLLGFTLPTLPLDIAGTLSGTPQVLRAANVTGQLGASDFSGDFSFALQGKPDLSIDVRSRMLDLGPFLGAGASAAAPERTRKKPKVTLVPDWELPLGDFGRANVRLSVQAGKIRFRGDPYEDLRLKATLTNGHLVVDPVALGAAGGGNFSARLEVSSRDTPPTVHVTATGHALPFSLIPGAVSQSQMSRYEADVDLTGAGANLRDLVASVVGRIRLTGTGGRLSGTALNSLSGDFLTQLLTTINPFAKKQPYTDLVCQALLFKADAGMLRTDPAVVLRTNQVDVISQGTIDLRTEKIDFNFKTAARSGIGISAADLVNPYIKVSGTLADPRIGVNPKGTIVSGGAAVATGGLSILAVAAWDRISRDKDPCAAAVRESEKKK